MKLGEHISTLAAQSGIAADNPALKSFLSNVSVSDYDLPDEIASKISSSLLTIEAAKNHPELKRTFFAQALNGTDNEMANWAKSYGLSDLDNQELSNEKSTPKRMVMMFEKVKALEAGKATAAKGDKAEFQKQIDELNSQIKAVNDTASKAISDKENEFKSQLANVHLSSHLSTYKYATDLAKEENYTIPKMKLSKELKEKGLQYVVDGETLKLEREDGTDYFENNVKVDFKSFTDKVLAQHKLTAVSDPNPTQNPVFIQPEKGGLNNSKFAARASELESQIK